jgi:hypothetical protein
MSQMPHLFRLVQKLTGICNLNLINLSINARSVSPSFTELVSFKKTTWAKTKSGIAILVPYALTVKHTLISLFANSSYKFSIYYFFQIILTKLLLSILLYNLNFK